MLTDYGPIAGAHLRLVTMRLPLILIFVNWTVGLSILSANWDYFHDGGGAFCGFGKERACAPKEVYARDPKAKTSTKCHHSNNDVCHLSLAYQGFPNRTGNFYATLTITMDAN